jgi:hypothetical protein
MAKELNEHDNEEQNDTAAAAARVVKTAERVARIAGERPKREPPAAPRHAPRKQPVSYEGPTATSKALRGEVSGPRTNAVIAELMQRLPGTRITQVDVSAALKKRR